MFDLMTGLDIDNRTGWPDDLRLLLDRYPREVWATHPNLGELARFWLEIHNGFRSFGGKLESATTAFREGQLGPDRFRSWFMPRLNVFLSHLAGHHQIEDAHFFPRLAAVESRLKRGFDVLEQDHDVIHAAMDAIVESANGYTRASPEDSDRMRRAADEFAAAGDRLRYLLDRHLEDEEDLIVPLILDRGEQHLGV
jgi:hypothetical protein